MTRTEPNLRIPGPTALPPSVREAGARQMINHRGPEFKELLARLQTGMKPYFGTTGDIAILSCAGTGGLEAAVVNTLSPGDRVLGVSIGAFGDRFAKIAEAYGATVDKVAAEWGWAAAPDEVRERLAAGGGDYRAVLLTHNETSTGVMNPIPELAAAIQEAAPGRADPRRHGVLARRGAVRHGCLGRRRRRDGLAEGLDGRARAWRWSRRRSARWAAMETAKMPRFYLDLRKHRDSMADGETPWTPAIAVAFQVDEGLRLMNEEGQAGVFARHVACAAATQAGLETLGFQLFAEPANRSKTVTAAWIPDGLDWKAFNGEVKRRRRRPRGRPGQARRARSSGSGTSAR